MGMFDSFYLKNIKCPYCGEITDEMDFQTKQFECMMDEWREGDEFTGMNVTLGIVEGVYGGCCKPKCKEFVTKRDGYWGGFGRQFYCDVIIADKKVKGATNIRKDDDE